MRLRYHKKELNRVYNSILRHAEMSFSQHDVEAALCRVQLAAELQYIVNEIFLDERLEHLLGLISVEIVGKKKDYKGKEGTVLFYDHYGLDNRGLTQQYLDALYQIDGISVVYVLENTANQKCENTLRLVKEHGSKYYELGDGNYKEKIIKLCKIIEDESPSDVFLHISPSSPIPFTVLSAFPTVRKILINITDHAFGIGGGRFYDYSFEFREYGAKISLEKRAFELKQLLLLPYYPWQEETTFQGFPIPTDGKVVLFSGSYLYKIDDKENTFFNIIADILKANPNAVMFFAGGGDDGKLRGLIEKANLGKRFYLLGNRTDISSLFKHIDIYIGTYPLAGGLMTQYASINAKPILAYKTHEIEEVVCNKHYKQFVFDSKDDLLTEANHLIRDKKYREEQGKVFGGLTASQSDFRERFKELYVHLPGLQSAPNIDIDYNNHTQRHINNLNSRNNFRIEREIMTTCFPAISWKMIANVILNVNILTRLFNVKR